MPSRGDTAKTLDRSRVSQIQMLEHLGCRPLSRTMKYHLLRRHALDRGCNLPLQHLQTMVHRRHLRFATVRVE